MIPNRESGQKQNKYLPPKMPQKTSISETNPLHLESYQQIYGQNKLTDQSGKDGQNSINTNNSQVARQVITETQNKSTHQQTRMGPNFGSGAYSQKQKVGILEPDLKICQKPHEVKSFLDYQEPRKSSLAQAFQRRGIQTNRLNQNAQQKNVQGLQQYDQILNNSQITILDQMCIFLSQSKLQQTKNKNDVLKNLSINFEEILRQIMQSIGNSNNQTQNQIVSFSPQSFLSSQAKVISPSAQIENQFKKNHDRQLNLNSQLGKIQSNQEINNGLQKNDQDIKLIFPQNKFGLQTPQIIGINNMTSANQFGQNNWKIQHGENQKINQQIHHHHHKNSEGFIADHRALFSKQSNQHSFHQSLFQLSNFKKQIVIKNSSTNDFQSYKLQSFNQSNDLLRFLDEYFGLNTQQFFLLRTQNKNKYGESDKNLQGVISLLNVINLNIFKLMIEFQTQNQDFLFENNNNKIYPHIVSESVESNQMQGFKNSQQQNSCFNQNSDQKDSLLHVDKVSIFMKGRTSQNTPIRNGLADSKIGAGNDLQFDEFNNETQSVNFQNLYYNQHQKHYESKIIQYNFNQQKKAQQTNQMENKDNKIDDTIFDLKQAKVLQQEGMLSESSARMRNVLSTIDQAVKSSKSQVIENYENMNLQENLKNQINLESRILNSKLMDIQQMKMNSQVQFTQKNQDHDAYKDYMQAENTFGAQAQNQKTTIQQLKEYQDQNLVKLLKNKKSSIGKVKHNDFQVGYENNNMNSGQKQKKINKNRPTTQQTVNQIIVPTIQTANKIFNVPENKFKNEYLNMKKDHDNQESNDNKNNFTQGKQKSSAQRIYKQNNQQKQSDQKKIDKKQQNDSDTKERGEILGPNRNYQSLGANNLKKKNKKNSIQINDSNMIVKIQHNENKTINVKDYINQNNLISQRYMVGNLDKNGLHESESDSNLLNNRLVLKSNLVSQGYETSRLNYEKQKDLNNQKFVFTARPQKQTNNLKKQKQTIVNPQSINKNKNVNENTLLRSSSIILSVGQKLSQLQKVQQNPNQVQKSMDKIQSKQNLKIQKNSQKLFKQNQALIQGENEVQVLCQQSISDQIQQRKNESQLAQTIKKSQQRNQPIQTLSFNNNPNRDSSSVIRQESSEGFIEDNTSGKMNSKNRSHQKSYQTTKNNQQMEVKSKVNIKFDAQMTVEGDNNSSDGNQAQDYPSDQNQNQQFQLNDHDFNKNEQQLHLKMKQDCNQSILQKQLSQSLESLVKIRQKINESFVNDKNKGIQYDEQNEQKNANLALELVQMNMLKDASSYKLSQNSQISQGNQNQPLSILQKFERDYYFPPVTANYREIDLPDQSIILIVQYFGIQNITKFQQLSRNWYAKIHDVLKNMSQKMENRFIEMYQQYFKLIKTKITLGPTEFGIQKGLRIDRLMEIQLKDDSQEVSYNDGKTLKIENVYRYSDYDINGNHNNSTFVKKRLKSGQNTQKSVVFRPQGRQQIEQQNQNIVYHNIYRFDILKSRQQARRTWIHLSDRLPGYSQNEIQVAPGDRIIIGFCIYNLNGFVDIENLQWVKPSFAQIHESMVNFMQYNRDHQIQRFGNPKQARGLKILCDIDRICDVEDSVYDWLKFDLNNVDYQQQNYNLHIQMPIVVPPNLLEYFEVLEIWYNESDQHYNKKILRAIKPCYDKRLGSKTNFNLVLQFDEKRRFSLSILPRDFPIINEIRRRGVITDRNKREEEIQIRVGDIITLYETKHIPAEQQKTTNLGD